MDVTARTDRQLELSSRFFWWLPRIAFGLFVAALGALLWLSHVQDLEEQRATLISDVLWLEQNIRFQLVRNEELLARSYSGRPDARAKFTANARALLSNDSGLRQLLIRDAGEKLVLAEPATGDAVLVGEPQGAVPSESNSRLAGSLGKAVYSAAYPVIADDWQFEVHVPIFEGGKPVAIAIGIYSLRQMVDESVPWWLAERYRISVIDGTGHELVARSKVLPTARDASYELAFDPPGYGLLLSATPYQTPSRLLDRLLLVVVILLATVTLGSLWLLRRHVQHRLRAEQDLRKEYRFRQAMERSIHTGMRARDLNGKIIYVNEAFCRMVGWRQDELIGRQPPMPYWPENAIDDIRSIHDRILSGSGPSEGFELPFRRRNGESFTALVHEAPLIDDTGRQTGWMGSVVDISDRKAAEEATLRQQERLQATSRLVAMGEIASGLAHELNQPLAAISSYCSGALNMLRANARAADVQPALEKAVEQTRRAAQIIRRIYALVKRGDGQHEAFSLGDCIDSTMGLLEGSLRRQSTRIVRSGDFNPMIEGDSVLVEQALFNLLRNAGDAMRESPMDERTIIVDVAPEGCYAHLRIFDRGPGISPEIGSRLFDPLFTTKAEGMGMGLSIARSVIESHKGRIWFDANPAGGTIFHVLMPTVAK